MKIAITGNPGSGKTSLALRLHKQTKLPVYHLDQYYWKPGWQRPDRQEFKKDHHSLCDKPKWIIEGVATRLFDYRAEKADVIIFLDIPTYICIYRVLKRTFLNMFYGDAFAAKDCPPRIPTWEFITFIWNFNKNRKPVIEKILKQHEDSKKIFTITNKDGLNEIFKC